MCKFCHIGYPVNDLVHQLTLYMILKTKKLIKEQHLGGDYEWLQHGDPLMFDQVMLYQPHRVCKNCFDLFKEVEKLKAVEKEFARALGIPLESSD